jgi:hypothetical protein
VTLSIKLLEEIERKEALEKYGSEGSGKNLPFSSLSKKLEKKDKNWKKKKKKEYLRGDWKMVFFNIGLWMATTCRNSSGKKERGGKENLSCSMKPAALN